jgi:hypothetical protein
VLYFVYSVAHMKLLKPTCYFLNEWEVQMDRRKKDNFV